MKTHQDDDRELYYRRKRDKQIDLRRRFIINKHYLNERTIGQKVISRLTTNKMFMISKQENCYISNDFTSSK